MGEDHSQWAKEDHGVMHKHHGSHGLRCTAVANSAKINWDKYKKFFKVGLSTKLAGMASYEKKMKGELESAVSLSPALMLGKEKDQELTAEKSREQYVEEGDARLYTSAALKKRRALRNRDDIRRHIRKLWRVLTLDKSSACDGTLDRDGYFTLNVSLFKSLMPDFDHKEALIAAEEDWQNDCGDGDHMGYGRFFDSIFELVDVWSPSLAWQDYVFFLRRLIMHLVSFESQQPRVRLHNEVT